MTKFFASILVLGLAFGAADAEAAKRKKTKAGTRPEMTSEQMNRFMDNLRRQCQKRWGPATQIRVNWKRNTYTCVYGG